jgi:hypothetical protein
MEEQMKIKQAPDCPKCGVKMLKTENPPFSFSDGLGWCVPYFYVCFNNECDSYAKGWDHLMKNYGKTASYRCMIYPDSGAEDTLCVLSPEAYTGQIMEE